MYESKSKSPETDELCKAILSLNTVEECYRFFDDIFTIREIKDISQRLQVAKLLRSGAIFNDIVKKTGASTATIARVNRCLNYGADGYKMILNRLDEQEKEETKE